MAAMSGYLKGGLLKYIHILYNIVELMVTSLKYYLEIVLLKSVHK